MELAHLPFKNGHVRGLRRRPRTAEGSAGRSGRSTSDYGTSRLIAGALPDDVVIGGGNAKKLKKLPKGCRPGDNANAFIGGFRLFENVAVGFAERIPVRRARLSETGW